MPTKKSPDLSVVPEAAESLEDRSDDELMLLARGGRRDAFDVLVRRHQTRVLNLAHKYTSSVSLAKDAAQNAFVELYRYLPRYKPQGKFVGFLCRLVVNQSRMLLRKRSTRLRLDDNLRREVQPKAGMPDDALLERERRLQVQKQLNRLSDKLRIVVVLRYTQDLSYNEISETLGLPVGTVKSRLAAAMDNLKKLMEAEQWAAK